MCPYGNLDFTYQNSRDNLVQFWQVWPNWHKDLILWSIIFWMETLCILHCLRSALVCLAFSFVQWFGLTPPLSTHPPHIVKCPLNILASICIQLTWGYRVIVSQYCSKATLVDINKFLLIWVNQWSLLHSFQNKIWHHWPDFEGEKLCYSFVGKDVNFWSASIKRSFLWVKLCFEKSFLFNFFLYESMRNALSTILNE